MSGNLVSNENSQLGVDVQSSINKVFIGVNSKWIQQHNKNEQKSHYYISSVDLSADADDQCQTWKTLGFELFEIIVLTIMGIGAIYRTGKLIFRSKGLIAKWKENKRKKEEKDSRNSE